jgi:hypothetical protein
MGRIFISAGHGSRVNGTTDPGSVVGGTTEAREMILTRDLVMTELRSRSVEVLSVPDSLGPTQAIEWINTRGRRDDVAIEIRADAFTNPSVRGATVYHIANNQERRRDAELLLQALIRRTPQLPGRGAKPDTETGLGSLPFCRQLVPRSLLMTVGFLTNPDDRYIIQNQRRDMVLGIADGLVAWVRGSALPTTPPGDYLEINISLNGQNYGEKGLLINGNAFIPIDLADRLNIDVSKIPAIRRVNYRQVVFIKAVDLRDFNISVGWENQTRTVVLRSTLKICPGTLDRIFSSGNTSEIQLIMFLKNNNENALVRFPSIAQLYRQEALWEGVNYDIAFCQMCLETNFLRFGGAIKPEQNNFAGLGDVAGGPEGTSFRSIQDGVRAHIQMLKAYSTTEPVGGPDRPIIAPRFRFITRGIAPLVEQLSGRWSADPQYGAKITALVRRLYESAQLL